MHGYLLSSNYYEKNGDFPYQWHKAVCHFLDIVNNIKSALLQNDQSCQLPHTHSSSVMNAFKQTQLWVLQFSNAGSYQSPGHSLSSDCSWDIIPCSSLFNRHYIIYQTMFIMYTCQRKNLCKLNKKIYLCLMHKQIII